MHGGYEPSTQPRRANPKAVGESLLLFPSSPPIARTVSGVLVWVLYQAPRPPNAMPRPRNLLFELRIVGRWSALRTPFIPLVRAPFRKKSRPSASPANATARAKETAPLISTRDRSALRCPQQPYTTQRTAADDLRRVRSFVASPPPPPTVQDLLLFLVLTGPLNAPMAVRF
jgi:hypothetical protein